LVISSVVDIGIAATLAIAGIAMAPIPALLVAGTLAAAALFALVLDLIKVPVFAHLGLADSAAISTTGGQKSEPAAATQSAAEPSNPANATRPPKAAAAPEVKAEAKPNAKAAPAPGVGPTPASDLTPKLIERVHALYEELGRQDVLAVQEFEQAQKASKEKLVQ
jgi:hypothetical protein